MLLAYGFYPLTTFDYVQDFCVVARENISKKPMKIKSSYQANKITFALIPHILIPLAIFLGGLAKNMCACQMLDQSSAIIVDEHHTQSGGSNRRVGATDHWHDRGPRLGHLPRSCFRWTGGDSPSLTEWNSVDVC
jgi:hypothetical protein